MEDIKCNTFLYDCFWYLKNKLEAILAAAEIIKVGTGF